MSTLRTALLVASAALAGLPALASAQPPQQQQQDQGRPDRGDRHGDRGDRPNRPDRPDRGGAPQGQAQPAPAPAPNGTPAGQGGNRWGPNAPGGQGGFVGRGSDHPNPDRWGPNAPGGQGGFAGRGPDRPNPDRWGPNAPGGQGGYAGRGPGWDRGPGGGWNHGGGWNPRPGPGGWRDDRRYDWHGWRDQHRELFRAPRYVPPRGFGFGFGYRVFAPGYRLQPYFYDRSYWIDDPWSYRLPPADGPYRWVRYYNDVLLVDLRSGYVVDVIRDFFW